MLAMGTTTDTGNQSASSPAMIGVVCVLIAVGLLLGALCWLGVTVLIGSMQQPAIAVPPIVHAAGLLQVIVSMLFGVAGVFYVRKSRRAKVLLWIAGAALALELPLAMIAFSALIAARR
jgi:hypothetical protein